MKNPECALWKVATSLGFMAALLASGMVSVNNKGTWSEDWPRALDAFRKQAQTFDIATGLQEQIHQIQFNSESEFVIAWPAILEVKTPGSPVTLYWTNSPASKAWNSLVTNAKPAVRIYTPSYSFAGSPGTTNEINLDLVVDGAIIDLSKVSMPKGIIVNCDELPVPELSADQKVALVKEASEAFRKHVRTNPKNRPLDIAESAWGPVLRSLKPIRVVDDKVNIKIVLSEAHKVEAGFYVNQAISSFAPGDKYFLEYLPLNLPEESTFASIARYKLVQR